MAIFVKKRNSDMNKKFLLLALLCSIISCNNSRNSSSDPNNQEFSIPEDSMIMYCAKLKGLGPLRIDSTTFSMALTEEIFKSVPDYEKKSDFSGVIGEWVVGSGKEDLLNGSKNIKRLKFFSFQIGEIPFDGIEMAFYKDTLCAMSIEPKDIDGLIDHYISLYGTGDGHYKISNKEEQKYFSLDEYHRWYNNKLEMEYVNRAEMIDGKLTFGNT